MSPSRFDTLSRVSSPDRGGLDTPFDLMPIIEMAEIQAVDAARHTVTLFTKSTGKLCRDVDLGGPGLERDGGFMGGMPKVGDLCLVAFPSDDVLPRIITMLPYTDPRNVARGKKRAMRPGDKVISTGAGNYVHVYAGGVVDIAANPITRRMYVPVLNQIKDFCENYMLNTGGGRMRWEVRRDQKNGNGAETELIWEIKDFTDSGRVLELRRGNVARVDDMPTRALDHKAVYEAGTTEVIYRCTVDATGNVFVMSAGGSTESWEGQRVISAQGGLVLTSEPVGDFDEDPGKTRGSVHIGDAGVELAMASEKAVLGQTLKALLEAYDGQIQLLLQDLGVHADTLSLATDAVAQTPAGPMVGPIKAYTESVKKTLNAVKTNLSAIKGQFHLFLAKDTKLS